MARYRMGAAACASNQSSGNRTGLGGGDGATGSGGVGRLATGAAEGATGVELDGNGKVTGGSRNYRSGQSRIAARRNAESNGG